MWEFAVCWPALLHERMSADTDRDRVGSRGVLGVFGNLVIPAAFKAVGGPHPRPSVGSIPIHSRLF